MKAMRAKFLTRDEAYDAVNKLSAHCMSIKIINDKPDIYGARYGTDMYTGFGYTDEFGDLMPPMVQSLNSFGWNGIIGAERRYGYGEYLSGRSFDTEITEVDAIVEDEKYSYVKNLMLSCGALSII
jgi:hypothetical protein